MNIVNNNWVQLIWLPASEGADNVDPLLMMPMDVERNVLLLVDDYLKDYFQVMDRETKRILKNTWRYAISNSTEAELASYIEEMRSMFTPPHDVKDFYINVWCLLFPGEPWWLESYEKFTVSTDPELGLWGAAHPGKHSK